MADLPKLSVPAGSLRIEIDDPLDRCLEKPAGTIRGWFAAIDLEIPEDFTLHVGVISLPYSVVKREDVEAAMPDYTIGGFETRYDLASYLPYIQEDNYLVIRLTLPGYSPYSLRFKIKDSALATCLEAAGDV
jgi:hypothetical protein